MWLVVLSIWIKFGLSWFVSFILKGEQSILRKKLSINWLSQLLSYTSNKHFSYMTSCVLWRCVAWFWQTWKRAFLKSGRFTLDENTLRITSGYWRSKLRLMILWIIKVEKRSSPAVNSAQLWLPLSPVPHTHAFWTLPGMAIPPCPGQFVPMPDQPFSEETFPSV